MRYWILLFILFGMYACTNKEKMQDEILQMESELYEQELIDDTLAGQLIGRYESYMHAYPSDSFSITCALSVAKLYAISGDPAQAVENYKYALNNYDSFSKRAEVLFMLAFVYESSMNELDSAEHYYKTFIKQYPNHELADDALFSLEYLRISDTELIRMFEEMNAVDTANVVPE